jgi:Ca2+-binding RTX toxin-like protein
MVENANEGVDTIWSSLSTNTLGANIENLIFTGPGNVTGIGNALNNQLTGGSGNDFLTGNAGADTLTGGTGIDTFIFNAIGDSGVGAGNRDVITDFVDGTDHIDFSGMDANTVLGDDNNSFSMIGAADFSGTAGQLRYVLVGSDTLLQGDVNGDSVADFEVLLTGTHTFANAADLVL